ncbi:hypothetical protein NQ176_g9863 [Zarea fungicola]|uniref:Uncharacterized protein n=1 Tax=Zarea fungicola TaxID=93591 RepID=A0ACC1MJM1_9HYPO|nr:hypothetical protein NQ176_g9863 [Lecanicillium fungicola]
MDPSRDSTPIGDVDALIHQLQAIVEDPKGAAILSNINDAKRQQLKQLARAASVALEEPFETVQRLVYSPLPLITTRIAQEHKIFATVVGSQEPVSFDDLKNATGLQAAILESVLDYLGSQGMLREPQRGQYAPTGLTNLMMAPLFNDAITHL